MPLELGVAVDVKISKVVGLSADGTFTYNRRTQNLLRIKFVHEGLLPTPLKPL
jgi:hypothetical protein